MVVIAAYLVLVLEMYGAGISVCTVGIILVGSIPGIVDDNDDSGGPFIPRNP